MLQLVNALSNVPVLGLRAGNQIAVTREPILNPNNLKIEGWHCIDSYNKEDLILLTQDVRDIIDTGLVVNDHEALVKTEDLVRLQNIINLEFQLLNKPVYGVSKQKIGKVNDYATDTVSFLVKKLYVGQPLIKSLSGGSLTVDRSQIVEITDKKIVIKDPLQPLQDTSPATAPLAA